MAIVLIVFLQAALFALYHLHIRKLEELGISAHAIAGLQRYSIIPALILCMALYKPEYGLFLVAHPIAFWLLGGIAFFWGIGQYTGYVVLNSASSLALVHTIGAFIHLPIVFAASILLNHDVPNIYIVIGLGLSIIALLIKPEQHEENKRRLLSYSVIIILALNIANQIGHAVDGAFYKNLLHLLRPQTVIFGISLYILATSLMLNIIYLLPMFKKTTSEEKSIIKKYWWLAYSIPTIWFIASIPEGYGFANLPLFTLSALGAFSFLIKIASDLKNKRIVLNARTIIFILVVIASIVFSTLSVH